MLRSSIANRRGGIDEILEQVTRFRDLVAVAQALAKMTVQAAGHQRQLDVAVDLQRHGAGQRVHVEETHAVLDVVFDQHPLGITSDELCGRASKLVGQEQRRFFMAQIGDGDLPDRPLVVRQGHLFVQDPRRLVDSRHAVQRDLPPGAARPGQQFMHQLRAATPQRDELDVLPIQLVQLGIGRELGIEDQFLRQLAGAFLPKPDELENLVVLLGLSADRCWRSRRSVSRRPGPKRPEFPSGGGFFWKRNASRPGRLRRERGSCESPDRTTNRASGPARSWRRTNAA